MSTYAADTSVSVEKTRAEMETMLARFGADAFGYMVDAGRACIQFRCNGRYVRFVLPLPRRDDDRFVIREVRGRKVANCPEDVLKYWEQACRSAWRALFLAVKAKLVAVDAKITTFEQEFLAHIVLPDGTTAGDVMIPQIKDAYQSGRMPKFTLALPTTTTEGGEN